MSQNFNVEPYYDDFDPAKNFHRILFKPGVAVQARELTQAQTILQNQISNFADGIYEQNVPVKGGNVTINSLCYYLKLNSQYSGVNITASNFKNKVIKDTTNGTIIATVVAVTEGSTGGDPPTLIVNYTSGIRFTDGMTLIAYDSAGNAYRATTIGTAGGTTCTGYASVASISEGIYYINTGSYTSKVQSSDGTYPKYSISNFVFVPAQTIILSKYTNTPNCRVGLTITESIVDYSTDTSLLDPALGSSNYQAPGADRYQLSLELTYLSTTLGTDDNFIELVRVDNGLVVKKVNNSVYSDIDDYIAKRTYDTNGNFIVKDFSLTAVANTSSNNTYNLRVGAGTAFVRGYEIENTEDTVISVDRARSTATQNNNVLYLDYGSYLLVDTVNGYFDPVIGQTVDLHSVAGASVWAGVPGSGYTGNTNTYNSTFVGRGYIRNLTYQTNTADANTLSYVYKAHIHDIQTNTIKANTSTGTLSSITFADTGHILSNVANAYLGVTLTVDSGTGIGYTGKIVNYSGATRVANVSPSFFVAPDSSTKVSLRFSVENTKVVANANTGQYIFSTAYINNSGRKNGVATGDAILFNTDAPELLFPVGQSYVAETNSGTYYSTRVFRYVSMSAGGSFSVALPGSYEQFYGSVGTQPTDAVKQNYTVIVRDNVSDSARNGANGTILDFSTSGNTVTLSADKLTATFSSTQYRNAKVDVISKIYIATGDNTNAIRKTKYLVTGNTTTVSYTGVSGSINSNTYIDLTKGQTYIKNAVWLIGGGTTQSLYVTDVKKIRKIIDTGAAATVPTDVMLTNSAYDVTSNFSFNNGQKDSYYDHAFVSLNPGAPLPKGNILVVFDFYKHDVSTGTAADGYFNVNSYVDENYAEIPVYTAKNGKVYALRDCLDFRPTRTNATSSFTYEIKDTSSGIHIPIDLSSWVSNYSNYLARKDVLVISSDNNLQVIKGTPAVNPSLPPTPQGSLTIANLSHDPYTAYLPSEAPRGVVPNLSIEKVQHRRWTMDDISQLNTRVNNLEYYTSLSLLEKNAQSLQVPDANGLNRFKNGILVDDFSSFAVSDTSSQDFSVTIDKINKTMTAAQMVQNYPLQSVYNINALNNFASNASIQFGVSTIDKGTNIFTLPYSNTSVVVQQLASSVVNLNPFGVGTFTGTCTLTPPMDNWVDITRQPDLLVVDPNLQVFQSTTNQNLINLTNWQTIPGTERKVTTAPTTSTTSDAFGTSIVTTSFTQTYANQQRTATISSWDSLGTSYNSTNGFISDISIQAYIRPQQIMVRASGLKSSTPISTWFDGVNVDNYMSQADVIELTGVSGTFKVNDIVGYNNTNTNRFYPIGSVLSTYVNPATPTSVRLYITGNYHSGIGRPPTATFTITNSQYNTSGTYVGYTASGTAANNIINPSTTGYVSCVGGTFTDVHTTPNTIPGLYHSNQIAFTNAFENTFGVWTAPQNPFNDSGTLVANPYEYSNVTFSVNFPTSGTYYFSGVASGSATFYLDTGTAANSVTFTSTDHTVTQQSTYVAAGTYKVRWLARDTRLAQANAQVALAISTNPWNGATTTGKIIFASNSPTKSQITNYTPSSAVTSSSALPGGGTYYTGVNTIGLGGAASANNNYYVGSTINFTTVNVSLHPITGLPITSTETYSSTITAYTGSTRLATLSPAVNLSMGFNSLIGGSVTSQFSIIGTANNYVSARTSGAPAKLSTNENGEFVGIFNVPQNTFRTGDRIFHIDNRAVATDPSTATTSADATFTASGLTGKSQTTSYAPSIMSARGVFTRTETKDSVAIGAPVMNRTETYIPTRPIWSSGNAQDPVAQSFIIDKRNYPYGVFLSSIRVFFKSKPTTTNTPVTLSIVGTQNGYPNGVPLDYSIVTKTPDQINISDDPQYLDPTKYTEFNFSAPVYIQPETLYAFILKSDSTEYTAYIAAQNSVALASSVKNLPTDSTPSTLTKITAAPYVGGLFESQNSITWVADPAKSLMFSIQRCVFNTSVTPKISFCVPAGLATRKPITQDIQKYYSQYGVNALYGSYNNVDTPIDAINVSTTDFTPTLTKIDYSIMPMLRSNYAYDSERTITPGKFGTPTFDNVYFGDGKGERVLQANNANSFLLYATLTSNDDTISPILSDDGLALYNIRYNINNLGLTNTCISLISGGSGYNVSCTTITFSGPDLPGGANAYGVPYITEGGVISAIYVTTPGSGYLKAPTVTIVDANTTPGTGASANVITELSPRGGNALARYISKRVTLAQGNDSADLRVYFTAYRPPGTDILVFYKILARQDTQLFDNGNWQAMTLVDNSYVNYSKSRDDVYEFVAAPGVNNTANNQVSYVSSTTNVTYYNFYQYAIKVVLTTGDNTIVPFVDDIRVLALPSGSGL